ncbi:MAG: RHS repeat-associated core domain-containing protein [Planctomycetia bacterium]|nr:RHS repeat-associated core domain-containing protein [Planctomycetia bacterium]
MTSTLISSKTLANYDGDSSYGDWEFNANDPPTPDNLRSYEPGLALKDPWDESSGIEYYHADLIGTTRGTTDHLGAPAIGASGSPVTYTAFGERLDSDDYLRYGYAGSWGYQAHDVPNGDPVQFFHVGWRYYDPSTGRFLQRDPIGLNGGWNVYEYATGLPTLLTDPLGLDWWTGVNRAFLWVTGGCGNTYLDRVGNNIGARKSLSDHVADVIIGGAAARVPKKGKAGRASTKSIWQKKRVRGVTGGTIRSGMKVGKVCAIVTIIDGGFRWYQIVDACVEEW